MNSQAIFSIINQLSFDIPAFIIAILWHEYFHVATARKLMGNEAGAHIKFRPISHLDLVGTLLPVALVISGYPIVFGWGKDLQMSFADSERKRSCEIIFSLSGIIGSLFLCLITGLFISLIPKFELLFSLTTKSAGIFAYTFIFRLFSISLAIMLVNFLPIPPFDGARLMFSFFEKYLKPYQEKLQILGLLIVVTLILTGIAGIIFIVPYTQITNLLCGAFAPYVLSPGSFAADFLAR